MLAGGTFHKVPWKRRGEGPHEGLFEAEALEAWTITTESG